MSYWEQLGKSDEYYTPKYVFDALECRFDMDVAAPLDRTFVNVPADRFVSSGSLEHPWDGFVWMNPPFGGRMGILPWLNKISLHRPGGIALTPDRSSAPWWQSAARTCGLMLHIDGKIKFIRPDGSEATQPSNGTTLFAWGIQATRALIRADMNGLGIATKRII